MFKVDVLAISALSSNRFWGKEFTSHFRSLGKLSLRAHYMPGLVGCDVDRKESDTALFPPCAARVLHTVTISGK